MQNNISPPNMQIPKMKNRTKRTKNSRITQQKNGTEQIKRKCFGSPDAPPYNNRKIKLKMNFSHTKAHTTLKRLRL